jgi:hypothetical protein
MDFPASGRTAGFLKRRFSSFYGRFKSFRATRDDLAIYELPADAVCRKEVVDRLPKCRRFPLIPDRVVIGSFKPAPDSFDDIVNLKPLTPINILLRFLPEARVFTPIAAVSEA